jgi:hypothetical protein
MSLRKRIERLGGHAAEPTREPIIIDLRPEAERGCEPVPDFDPETLPPPPPGGYPPGGGPIIIRLWGPDDCQQAEHQQAEHQQADSQQKGGG